MKDRLLQFLEDRRGRWLVPLLLLAVFGVLAAFFELATEVRAMETRKFDSFILLSMRVPGDPTDPIGDERVEEVARDLTALGGLTVLTMVSLVAFGVAAFSNRKKLGFYALGAVVLGTALTSLLKKGYNRPRPELVEHAVWVSNMSFPSGHSMMSAIVYLTLGILLARTQARTSVRVFIMAVAVTITVLVGISRIYLGVHWPTDVLAGWAVGVSWAVLFWLLAMKIDPRRTKSVIP